MGCDIHAHVEREHKTSTDGTWWEPIAWPIVKCWSCDGKGVYENHHNPEYEGKPCRWCSELPSNYDEYSMSRYVGQPGRVREQFLTWRNYSRFAILAGVRSYGTLEAIDEPRGLPEDVSEEVQAASDEYGIDGHSHSHVTFEELFEFLDKPREKQGTLSGFVQAEDFARFHVEGAPHSWCQDTSGKKITNEQMDALIQVGLSMAELSRYYTWIEWPVGYREEFGLDGIEQLEAVTKEYPEDNLRLVFWFDN